MYYIIVTVSTCAPAQQHSVFLLANLLMLDGFAHTQLGCMRSCALSVRLDECESPLRLARALSPALGFLRLS